MKAIDLTGRKFGRLTVISLSPARRYRRRAYICKCECGNKKEILGECLSSGATASCGCIKREQTAAINRTHGQANKTREYKSWVHMKGRCLNRKDAKYPQYGGRGIKIDPRWNDFAEFIKDMGMAPTTKHTLDRIDVNGNYTPSNCRWATLAQQAMNKQDTIRITIGGVTRTFKEWCTENNVPYKTAWKRMRKDGWDADRLLTLAEKVAVPQ